MPLFKVLPKAVPAGEPFRGLIRAEGEGADRIEAWARAVGRVHGARRRETVTATFDMAMDWSARDEGEATFDARTGAPIALRIPVRTDAPECAFLHEIGHTLDRRHLGDGVAFASESDPGVQAVVRIAREAPSLADSIALVEALGRRSELDERDAGTRDRLARLLSDREVFARAYTQYVAEMMRPPVVRMQIARRMIQCWDAGAFPLFWTPEEFPAIARAMHERLLDRGLIALRT